MIDVTEAVALAEALLDEQVRPWIDEPVAIASAKTVEMGPLMVFFYNTVAYLETGKVTHALAGNGPVIVDRHARSARMASSGQPWEDQV